MNTFIQKTPDERPKRAKQYYALFFDDMNFHPKYAILRVNDPATYHDLN